MQTRTPARLRMGLSPMHSLETNELALRWREHRDARSPFGWRRT